MGLDTVIEEILARGRTEAGEIRKKAMMDRERMLQDMRSEGAKLLAEREQEARRSAERARVQALARAELESKKIVLAAQKDVLDEVYQGVLGRLRSLPDGSTLLRKLLDQNRQEWAAGQVFANPKDAAVVQAIVGKSFAGTIDCVGGIVIESADGSRRVDLRFESTLADLWNTVIRDVAEVLWPRA